MPASHAVVTAPFEGIIAERYLSPGALAGPGRPVARLVGHDEPRVRFAIPEDRAGAVAVGATVEVKIAPAGLLARGRVTGVSPDVDASSRMVFAAASLEPHPGPALGTGLLARVFLAPAPARER
jgi:multidrug resistance efflux pump